MGFEMRLDCRFFMNMLVIYVCYEFLVYVRRMLEGCKKDFSFILEGCFYVWVNFVGFGICFRSFYDNFFYGFSFVILYWG